MYLSPLLAATFSITQVVLGAAVTFLVSGVGGIFLQRFLARAKPQLLTLSLAFEGSESLIEIADRLVNASSKDAWGPNLAKYETYDALKQREERAATVAAHLDVAIKLVEDWLAKQSIVDRASSPLTEADIKAVPYALNGTVGGTLDGMIARSELTPAPISKSNVCTHARTPVCPLVKKDDVWHLYLGDKAVMFPTGKLLTDNLVEQMELMAESFSRGIRENIIHYMKEFHSHAKQDRVQQHELLEEIRKVLLAHARVSARIAFVNTGKSVGVIKPFLRLTFSHKHLSRSIFILAPMPIPAGDKDKEGDSLVAGLMRKKQSEAPTGSDVSIEQFLPSAGEASYIAIRPDSTVDLSFVATEPLGKDGKQVYEIYKAGVLECYLTALTLSNRTVVSSPTVFGARVSDALASQLRKQ